MKRAARGFSLIELLVAVAVFATASAMAYAGLAAITRTRARLGAEQQRFSHVERSVALLARDLGSAVTRPIRDSHGTRIGAMVGDAQRLEFTHVGAVGAPTQTSSALQRVSYFVDAKGFQRARYLVLDRAPDSVPVLRTLDDQADQLVIRYLDHRGQWHSRWPPARDADQAPLPRAVEFRLRFKSLGEIRRIIEMPASVPASASSIG
ncbi:MAG: type II secretion system minor pseudopilin GspJ [Xanthomonadales bacterium]|nr:type II secretion system minor pseudopilin GspJ [Xanthomonadales bacterium]